MPRYEIYVNAGIEIWDEVEAKNESHARIIALGLIQHQHYECDIQVIKIEETP